MAMYFVVFSQDVQYCRDMAAFDEDDGGGDSCCVLVFVSEIILLLSSSKCSSRCYCLDIPLITEACC